MLKEGLQFRSPLVLCEADSHKVRTPPEIFQGRKGGHTEVRPIVSVSKRAEILRGGSFYYKQHFRHLKSHGNVLGHFGHGLQGSYMQEATTRGDLTFPTPKFYMGSFLIIFRVRIPNYKSGFHGEASRSLNRSKLKPTLAPHQSKHIEHHTLFEAKVTPLNVPIKIMIIISI